jgi:AcrR family transcriptional regulator
LVSDVDVGTAPSLRERNKARARAEIAVAALALFAERGFQHVTVDDIVTAAGVSRRTFFRYFETKEDALLADYPQLSDRLEQAFERHGADVPALVAIRQALHAIADWYLERRDAVLARSSVIHGSSAPAARNLELLTQWEAVVAQVVALQIGEDATGLTARTISATVIAAFRAALSQWVRSGGADDLHALVDTAFDLVEHGVAPALAGYTVEGGG